MSTLGLPVLIALFVVAAVAVWLAGVKVSETTAILSRRLGWGTAIGGLVALAIVTNLPELAIVLSGAIRGDLTLAVGNILGGIAAQTVVLAILDRFGPRGSGPLTYRAAKLELVIEGLLVVAVLGLVLAGTQMPRDAIWFRLTPVPILIALVWYFGIRLIAAFGNSLPWRATVAAQGASPGSATVTAEGSSPRSATDAAASAPARTTARVPADISTLSTRKAATIFGIGALVTLVAGVALEQVSDAIADDIGMSGAIFGATILAAATSLPEVSTGITSVRDGHDAMAISDIFGGNAFLPVLFLPAVLISGSAVLPLAQKTDIFLTASALVLTAIYLTGLIIRPRRRIWGMGVDSFLVVIAYAATIAGVALI